MTDLIAQALSLPARHSRRVLSSARHRVSRRVTQQLCCHAAVITGFIAAGAAASAAHLNLASASVINLLLVVIIAGRFGLLAATAGSLAAFACLNHLFVPPVGAFTVADPQNWVSLAAFEASAVVVSRLSTTARRQTMLAHQERNDSERLYEASRHMLVLDRQRTPGPQMIQLIQRVFQPDLAVLFDAGLARLDGTDGVPGVVETATRGTYLQDRDHYDEQAQIWYRVLRLGSQPKGALALKGERVTAAVANGLASLTAIGLERARSFETESRAVAERHTEQLRAAVLDALAHEFKTPLTAIRTASAGLLEATTLSPEQRELAALVEEESVRLNDLASRLLGTARLEASEIVLRRQPTTLQELTDSLLQAGADRLAGRELRLDVSNRDARTPADRNLLMMALLQVLDNAVKYSTASTAIILSGWATDGEVCLSILNSGSQIPPAERSRIFERFYRLPSAARQASGTGLGLYVTRKIVEAHHGRVWAESEAQATAFTISLPRLLESHS
jgi:two-component system sensor histidine kinase KdpD